jgi:hypothetical protein
MTRSYLGAYWGPRAQSVDECAKMLAELIPKLAEIDPLLSGWRSGANSKRKAMEQPLVTADHMDLVQRLMAGRNRTDTDGAVIEELGYLVGWWSGSEDNKFATSISVHLGATTPWVPNSVVIKLPDSSAASSLYTHSHAEALVATAITIFAPDRAVWTSSKLTRLQAEPDRPTDDGGCIGGQLIGHPAGWATFLADSETIHFDLRQLPGSARVERLGTGTLVMLGDDPAEPPVPDVLQVRRAMGYPVVAHSDAEQPTQTSASPGQPTPAAVNDATAGHDVATHVNATPTRAQQHDSERPDS